MSSLRGIASNLPIRHLYRVDYFTATSGEILLTINKTFYVGRYSTIEDAQEVVKGILTKLGCSNVEERLLTLPSNINYTPIEEQTLLVTMNSWDADLTFPKTLSPTFDFTKNIVIVQRSGYDFSGNQVTRQISENFSPGLSHIVRLPYPENTDQDLVNNNAGTGTLDLDFAVTKNNVTARMAMPFYIYDTDAVSLSYNPGFSDGITTSGSAQVTNASTLASPPPVCNFSTYGDYAIMDGDNLVVDVLAYHISASAPNRAPNGISAVKFELFRNDETTVRYTITVSSTTLDENKVPVYRLFLPEIFLSTLFSPDDVIYIRATVLPWYGVSKSSVRVVYGSTDWNNRYNDFQDVRVVFKPIDNLDVYIAPDGNDTTGDGTKENPYLTTRKAMAKFATANNNKFQGNIYCAPGTYAYLEYAQNNVTGRDTIRYMITIQRDPTTSGEVIFAGGNLSGNTADNKFRRNYCLRFKNIYFDYSNARNNNVGDGITPGYRTVDQAQAADILCVIFDGCKFKSNDAHTAPSASNNFVLLTARRRFVVNCQMIKQIPVNRGWSGAIGSSTCSVFKGNLGNFYIATADVTCGNQVWSSSTGLWIAVTSVELPTVSLVRDIGNGICCYNELVTTNANQNVVTADFGNNYAFVCNMIYASNYDGSTATNATVRLWGDGNISVIDNVLIWHNTVSGGRCNMFYSDVGTDEILRTNISIRNNIFKRWYIKSETFAPPNSTRVGNWSVMNSVDIRDNVAGFNYAGVNSFPREFKYTNEYESESDVGLVIDNPYSGETGVTGGDKFSGWPRLASDYASELGFTVSDFCVTFTRAGAFAGLYTLGCGPDRYPAVFVPTEPEFNSYGSGFEFAISGTAANQAYGLSIGTTQLLGSVTLTQTNSILDTSQTLLGNQVSLYPTSNNAFEIRFRPSSLFDLNNGKTRAQNFIDAYPGGYVLAYYKNPATIGNQLRSLLTLSVFPDNPNYVSASAVTTFTYDGTIPVVNSGGTTDGLLVGETLRLEFYKPAFINFVPPTLDLLNVSSTNGQPPFNNVARILDANYPLLATVSWSGNLGTIYMKVSDTEFSTTDFATLGTGWKPITSGSVITAGYGNYIGFTRVSNKVGSGVITLTDYYTNATIDTFDLSIT